MKRSLVAAVFLLFSACATTTRLYPLVTDYDASSAEAISRLLLINIARARNNDPIHFTAVSSIAATYRFSFNAGVGPALTGDRGWLPMPSVGGGVEENPTISISPMQGDEFTQRLLTPFQEQKLTLLLRQGYDVDSLLRLLGSEVHLTTPDGARVVYRNRPGDAESYAEYRRLMTQLSSIQDRHRLFVEPLSFLNSWSVPASAVTPQSFEDTFKNFTAHYDAEHQSVLVTRRVNGRVMLSNYDPAELSNEDRFALHREAEEAPFNDLLIDIRAGFPGGEVPIHGRIRLRSFHEILMFVGRSMSEEPEIDVTPDARTPTVKENPRYALPIVESSGPVDGARVTVKVGDRYFAVKPDDGYQWNQKAFALLYQLYQMSTATVGHNGPAITIAK